MPITPPDIEILIFTVSDGFEGVTSHALTVFLLSPTGIDMANME